MMLSIKKLNDVDTVTGIVLLLLYLLTLFCAAMGDGVTWGWPALACLILFSIKSNITAYKLTPLLLAVALYIAIMVINLLLISPTLHIEALYFTCFLFFAYLVGRSLSEDNSKIAFKIGLGCFALLSVWAIFQYLTGLGYIEQHSNRANTVYTTPNSFAAALNLFLIPLLVIRICRSELAKYDWLILLLFSALLVSQSRGGWIAFFGAMCLCAPFLYWKGNPRLNKQMVSLAVKLIFITAVFVVYHQSDTNRSVITRANIMSMNEEMIDKPVQFSSIQHRLHFYRIAWEQFLEKPLLGNGYFNYKYFLNRDNTPKLAEKGTTHFVHNDYLQHLLDTGIVGFLCLLLMISTCYFQILILITKSVHDKQLLGLAIFAGVTGFFIHALGDFVFYPPGIVVFFGITLGCLDRVYLEQHRKTSNNDISWLTSLNAKKFKLVLFAVVCIVLISPVIAIQYAQAAADAKNNSEFTKAYNLIQTAQQIAPYESSHVYFEAKLWLDALNNNPTSNSAMTADRLLVKAMELNPFEKYLLLERARLHRDYPQLLEQPAGIDTVLAWQEEVLDWQSHIKNNAAQTEYIRTLSMAGRVEEARALYREMQQEILGSRQFKSLLRNIFNPQ